jgi:hypothetical protein
MQNFKMFLLNTLKELSFLNLAHYSYSQQEKRHWTVWYPVTVREVIYAGY